MKMIVKALQTILLVLFFIMVLLSMIITAPVKCIANKIIQKYKEKLTYAELYAVATVTKLEYRPCYRKNSFIFGPRIYGGEHYIYLSYEGKEYVIEDGEAFQIISVGDEIEVYGHIGVNEKSGKKYTHISEIVNTE